MNLNTFGRRPVLAVLVMMAFGALSASQVSAAVIFSNYGPGMTYNSDKSSNPYDGGALPAFDGPFTFSGSTIFTYRTTISFASFTTPAGSDWYADRVTLAINTHWDNKLFIVADVNGRPASNYDQTGYGSSTVPSTIDNGWFGGERDGNFTVNMEPGLEPEPEFGALFPRPMKGGTKYWLVLKQDYQDRLLYSPTGDPRAYTHWYRSSNDAAAPANANYLRDLPDSNGIDGYFIDGPRAVFQIEATAVVPEPTAAAVALPFLAAALLCRRVRRS